MRRISYPAVSVLLEWVKESNGHDQRFWTLTMQANMLQPKSRTGERTLIDELISEQRSLTAVDRFSQKHDLQQLPAQARYYRDLIPLTAPKQGEQYAFEVNLDQCSGCKACVTACHGLNGLDDEETWRETGLLHGGSQNLPLQQHVTTACHHCVDPGCLSGCPVLAYDKDTVTGIVRHLDDQCIGCQYCQLMCPYDVPKYSAKRGIVRKCDMCSNRLAVGEAPACVQACPTEAISITIVKQAEVVTLHRDSRTNGFLPSSPDPSITVPTTRYVSARPLPKNLQSGDAFDPKPQHAHLPLVFMLVLTQLSVGAFVLDWILSGTLAPAMMVVVRSLLVWIAAGAGLAGIAVSVAHLGRPMGAWRAFLGLKRSWLSREIVLFGLFISLALLYLAGVKGWVPVPKELHAWLLAGVSVSGVIGVFCSVMIYHDTHREFWALSRGGVKFFGCTLLLGLAAAQLSVSMAGRLALAPVVTQLAGVMMLVTFIKLAHEAGIFIQPRQPVPSSLKRTAILMSGALGSFTAARFVLGISGGLLLPLVLLLDPLALTLPLAVASFGLLLAGELLERSLFFMAVAPAKMPGGV